MFRVNKEFAEEIEGARRQLLTGLSSVMVTREDATTPAQPEPQTEATAEAKPADKKSAG